MVNRGQASALLLFYWSPAVKDLEPKGQQYLCPLARGYMIVYMGILECTVVISPFAIKL